MTGTRHSGGGVKKLISLFDLLIAVAFYCSSIICVSRPVSRRGGLKEIHEAESDKGCSVTLVDCK